MITKELKLEYDKIKEAFDSYIKGEIKVTDLKHVTSYYGVYNTRDSRFMTRVRRVGGEFTTQNLADLAQIIKEKDISFGHISTRDCIQLQGVPVESAHDVIVHCATHGMPFKGGGGNSYRNPLISPLSGISKESIFDVRPYALKLDEFMKTFDKAFDLGRKIKIAFSSESEDLANTAVNDLGFLAQIKDGVKGFRVYTGGGLGKNPKTGTPLFDFIEATEAIKVAVAMVSLFHEHGNRKVRVKARLRFLVEELGMEEFKKLFTTYFEETVIPAEYLDYQEADYKKLISNLNKSELEVTAEDKAAFEAWKTTSVVATRFENTSAVRLFIKNGNFKYEQFLELVEVMNATGCDFIRLSAAQDLFLPLVDNSNLYNIFKLLDVKLVPQQTKSLMFAGHGITCIGASFCSIGILDSVSLGEEVSKELDVFFENHQDIKADVYAELVNGIKISGCTSSCATHQVAPLGFMGMKRLIDGQLTECVSASTGGICNSEMVELGTLPESPIVTRADLPKYVVGIVGEFVGAYRETKVSFETFMRNYQK